jgi:hypothetical protein
MFKLVFFFFFFYGPPACEAGWQWLWFKLVLQTFWAKKNLVKSLLISTLDKVQGAGA